MAYTVKSIENLKDQINILDVVSSVVPLKRSGATYKGLCPFHTEKTPSFTVNEINQRYYCFGCNENGDAIEFVKKYYNLDFNEACERLANQYGIELEETRSSGENLEKYYAINRDASAYFYTAFTEKANVGYPYMKNRGIEPNILKRYGIGYADGEWDSLYKHLKGLGHDEKDMLYLGLISERNGKYFDKFRNRVMFPIINIRKKVIGFGGRALSSEDNPKYLNSQESKVFQKKNNLYGINISREAVLKNGYIILVEGYMDVISLAQAEVENVAASLGTALTENQARMIKRYVKKVVLCYDSDEAGRKAALRGMEILRKEDLDVRVMHVTDGKDPDDYIKKHGKEAFLELVSKAKPFGEYKIEDSIRGLDLEDHQDRIRAIKNIANVLKTLTPGEREEYANQYSKDLGISKSVLLEESSQVSNNKKIDYDRNIRHDREETDEDVPLNQTEKQLIRLLLINEDYVEKVKEHPELLKTETSKRIFGIIAENINGDLNSDIDMIIDELSDEDRKKVYDILESVIITEKEEDLFLGLLKNARIQMLQEEINEINEVLKYAVPGEGDEDTKNLMKRSMELQKILANEKAEVN